MAIYPGASASDSDLYIAVNATSTQLTDNPLSNSATTVNVTDATAFPSVGFISIDNEIIKYTGKTGTSFTGCTRGADGTTAASHVQNSQVFHNVIAAHHNASKDEIKAIEADLFGVQSALTPTAAASTATSILNRLNQIAQRFKDLTGLTNWYDAFTSFPVSKGGTGNTTLTSGAYLKGAGTSAITSQAVPIPVADGGTNSTSALANDKLIASHAGAVQEIQADASANSHKITNLAAATANGDAVRFEQLNPGKILQIVTGTTTTQASTVSVGYADTNLTATITPTASTSKILVLVYQSVSATGSSASIDGTFRVLRGATPIQGVSDLRWIGVNVSGSWEFDQNASIAILDSPATTSATTYKTQFSRFAGGGTLYAQRLNNALNSQSTIILIEIGQ